MKRQTSDCFKHAARICFLLCWGICLCRAVPGCAQQPYFVDGYHGGIYGHYPVDWKTQFMVDQLAAHPDWRVCLAHCEKIGIGSRTYGILSVLLQAWYDIEYICSVEPGAFAPPPKVRSAVIRLRRNSRTELPCDEKLFRQTVKTAFNQRRKTLRNALKPLLPEGFDSSDPIFDLRAERLSVEDFIALTGMISGR